MRYLPLRYGVLTSMRLPKKFDTTRPVRFIFAGGFLGSGKTTALAAVAQRLVKRGMRVGIITNDQTVNLVDTAIVKHMLQELDVPVAEVAGGCFCCRFDDLVDAAEQILAHKPDILLGESVGSCTDLVATVIRPLKTLYAESFQIAPLSVLTDPGRLRDLLFGETASRLPNDVMYLYGKQLEEADIIVLSKVDLLTSEETERLRNMLKEQFPDKSVLALSAKEGSGMDEWLELLLTSEPASGRQVLTEFDYDRYANAEAELGWLNATARLSSAQPFEAGAFMGRLITQLHAAIKAKDAEIAHLKFLIESKGEALWANLTRTGGEPTYGGSGLDTLQDATLTINARVRIAPDDLEHLVRAGLTRTAAEMGLEARVLELQAFRPAYPRPRYRMTTPVPKVVISKSFPSSPEKERIEEELAEKLVAHGLDTVVMPHICHLAPDAKSLSFLQTSDEPIIFLGWLQPRASFWSLMRLGIKGKMTQTFALGTPDIQERLIATINLAERCYCCENQTDERGEEIQGRSGGKFMEDAGFLEGFGDSPAEHLHSLSDHCCCNGSLECHDFCLCIDRWIEKIKDLLGGRFPAAKASIKRFEDPLMEGWYPIIDYSRCNQCLQCLEFCLFGVYETDAKGNLVVMNPDACKPGCPACSRVCPEMAIIFPLYEDDAAIAGAEGEEIKPFDFSLMEKLRGDYEQGKATMEDIVRACRCQIRSVSPSNIVPPKAESARKDRDYFDDLIERLAKE